MGHRIESCFEMNAKQTAAGEQRNDASAQNKHLPGSRNSGDATVTSPLENKMSATCGWPGDDSCLVTSHAFKQQRNNKKHDQFECFRELYRDEQKCMS